MFSTSSRSNKTISGSLLLVGALLASGCGGDKKADTPKPTTTTSTTTSTTTEVPPTTIPAAPVAVAPLTGMPIDEAAKAKLQRPALAVKIDNSVDAMPQEGLNQADIVFEIKVEGISRLMAVFHSQDAGEIGPTRSARYSDPPILALLGKPLFGWSGANDGVVKEVYRSSWVTNVNWDKHPKDYFRKAGRKAPHNLFTSTDKLFAYATPEQGTALQMFQYLGDGETNASQFPVPGMTEKVGDTPSAWVWDAAGNQWLRWQYNRRDNTQGAGQANATNVVIMEIEYKGGSKTPTAKTEGTGRVLVLTAGGNAVEGTWTRPSQLEPIVLTAKDGQPLKLAPGRTWVELTPGATAAVMSAETAASMLAAG
jgi:hypothetical protein